jgi:hypothetical protein
VSNEFVAVLVFIGAVAALAQWVASIRRDRAAERKLDAWRRGVEDWRR